VNGRTVCDLCCARLRQQLGAGTLWSRALRAVGAGTAAAVGGTLIYFGILATTGIAFGLIAAVVGVMVGKAVSWGSYGRGGWKYQTLAIALTYLSIGGSYVPLILSAMARQQAGTHVSGKSFADGRSASRSQPPIGTRPAATEMRPSSQPGIVPRVIMTGLVLLLLSVIAPFAAFSPIRLAILAIALYEAWKFNRRRVVIISGPHALTSAATSSAPL